MLIVCKVKELRDLMDLDVDGTWYTCNYNMIQTLKAFVTIYSHASIMHLSM